MNAIALILVFPDSFHSVLLVSLFHEFQGGSIITVLLLHLSAGFVHVLHHGLPGWNHENDLNRHAIPLTRTSGTEPTAREALPEDNNPRVLLAPVD